jgi:hypothetical protein
MTLTLYYPFPYSGIGDNTHIIVSQEHLNFDFQRPVADHKHTKQEPRQLNCTFFCPIFQAKKTPSIQVQQTPNTYSHYIQSRKDSAVPIFLKTMSLGKRSRDESSLLSAAEQRRVCQRLNPFTRTSILRAASRFTKPKQPLGTISTNNLNSISKTLFTDSATTAEAYCKRARFYNKVAVVRIPSRYQYPESMKQSIWGSMKEINENARRNTIEFASEGWDWRRATEDDAMYIAPNGELVHPVHVRHPRRVVRSRVSEPVRQI